MSNKQLDDMMSADAVTPAEDKLDAIRGAVVRRRSLDLVKSNLETKLSSVNKEIGEIDFRVLPDMFADAGVDRVDIPAKGNEPGYAAVLSDYYKASIAASWPPEKRDKAFDTLEELNLSAIVRVRVTVDFAPDHLDEAKALYERLSAEGFDPTMGRDVHFKTLTSAVQELYESGRRLSVDILDAIGAHVGKIVKLKAK